MKYCLDNMVFDGSISACIPKAACNQVMTSPYDATGSVGNNDIENTKLTENGKYDISVCYTKPSYYWIRKKRFKF